MTEKAPHYRDHMVTPKAGLLHWLRVKRAQNLITAPVIYSMVIPLLLLDIFVTLYQALCFPIYKIDKVRRGDHMVFDRQHLAKLTWIDKSHCTYCAYATGLIAYVSEIIGRTEEYFCPIKHAKDVLAAHGHYVRFLPYNVPDNYEEIVEQHRARLAEKHDPKAP
jgi:hypothetical protein